MKIHCSWLVLRSSFHPDQGTHQRPFFIFTSNCQLYCQFYCQFFTREFALSGILMIIILTQRDGRRERTAKVDRVTRVTTWFVSNLTHFRFATAVLLTFTTWKQAVWGCKENVSIFILLSLCKLLYKNFPFTAQTCPELGTRLSPVLGHRIWPTRSFRGYDQKEFQAMNFATLLLNSVANSQLVSAVLRYNITVQFNILKIKD